MLFCLFQQIKELENTVSSLRRLLASSEQEVVELNSQFEEVKGLNQKLQAEVDRLRTRPSPGPQIAEVTDERSILLITDIILTFTTQC